MLLGEVYYRQQVHSRLEDNNQQQVLIQMIMETFLDVQTFTAHLGTQLLQVVLTMQTIIDYMQEHLEY